MRRESGDVLSISPHEDTRVNPKMGKLEKQMSLIVRLLRRQARDARRRDIASSWWAKGSLIMVIGTLLVGFALTARFSEVTLQNPTLKIPLTLVVVSGAFMLLCGLLSFRAADGMNETDNRTLEFFEEWGKLTLPLSFSVYRELFQSHRLLFLFCVFLVVALVLLVPGIILYVILKAF